MSIYASMVPQYNTEFLRAGEQAMSASGALEQGDKRFASFRGLPVYETEAFDVDFLGENGIDPLKRPRQVRACFFARCNPCLPCSKNLRHFGLPLFTDWPVLGVQPRVQGVPRRRPHVRHEPGPLHPRVGRGRYGVQPALQQCTWEWGR